MNALDQQTGKYLHYCEHQKQLNAKSLKAYRIDLTQFCEFLHDQNEPLSKMCITAYVQYLHNSYKPRTAKRKIATIRAFINYLEFDEQIECNPMKKIRLNFREPLVLPKALPLRTINKLLSVSHRLVESAGSPFQYKTRLRNWAILELMFATGLRVSELCSIQHDHIDLKSGFLRIQGKGSKERIVFIRACSHYQKKTKYDRIEK